MICSICSKSPALYMEGSKGFCKDHRAEAVAAASRSNIRFQSKHAIEGTDTWSTGFYNPRLRKDRP